MVAIPKPRTAEVHNLCVETAAKHTVQQLGRIGTAMELLAYEINRDTRPEQEKVNQWGSVIYWLQEMIENERDDLQAEVSPKLGVQS